MGTDLELIIEQIIGIGDALHSTNKLRGRQLTEIANKLEVCSKVQGLRTARLLMILSDFREYLNITSSDYQTAEIQSLREKIDKELKEFSK
jgi:hypothetical protein